jgi:hypothetical protein
VAGWLAGWLAVGSRAVVLLVVVVASYVVQVGEE